MGVYMSYLRSNIMALLIVLFVAVAVSNTATAKVKKQKIHGFVTNVISSTQLEIDDYKVMRDVTLNLEFENVDEEQAIAFKAEDIRVGTELIISGDYDDETGELQAQSIKVILNENRKIKRTVLLERPPEIESNGESWKGSFFADGQRISVTAATLVVLKLNKSEREQEKRLRKAARKDKEQKKLANSEDNEPSTRLNAIEQIKPNTFMTYEGTRNEDGTITATRLEFVKNELENGESKIWKQLKTKIKASNFVQGKAGELKINKVGKFKLVPNEEAQEYLTKLGRSLIPALQKTVPEQERIPFQFFLVQEKHPNAFATANGIIVVHDSMLEALENESQLAFVLAHEISHSIQEHTWRQMQYHRKKLTALAIGGAVAGAFGGWGSAIQNIATLTEGAVRNGYSRDLENQADRLALEYLVSAGFDPREAPRAWKIMSIKYGDQSSDFFWSRHDSNATRRSYLMAELRNNYADMDFSKFTEDQGQFDRVAEVIKAGRQNKYKVKIKY